MLTGQFADKPTRGQSSRGLVNSPTAIFLLNHRQIIIYFYTKQKPKTKPNAIDYWKCSIE